MATKQEQAVRDYLLFLKDGSTFSADTSDLEKKLSKTDDPIERLNLRAQIAEASDVRPSLEQAFIDNVKSWADKQGISVEMLQSEGVDPAVLRKAGFRKVSRSSTSKKRSSSKRVTSDEIIASLPRKGSTFTVASVQQSTGASPGTVRRVISDLVNQGQAEEVGPDPDHEGRGRAAILYKRV